MFQSLIRQFCNNLDALRDFIQVLRPVLDQKTSDEYSSDPTGFIPSFLAIQAIEARTLLPQDVANKIREKFNGEININVVDTDRGRTAQLSVDGPDAKRHKELMKRLAKRARQRQLLFHNALISLVSSSEWFLSQILHQFFERHPDAAGIRERHLTYSDLQAMSSIDDAKRVLIEGRIEELLRGTFQDWTGFLKSTLKLTLSYLESDFDTLVEICQRRNLCVHNGGVINAIYLNRVSESARGELSVGDNIEIDEDYLSNSISCFERAFVLVAAELWKKLDPKDESRADCLVDIAYGHLQAERWHVAEGLSIFVKNDKSVPEKKRLYATVNYWQSQKWSNRFEKVRAEIENEDFSAKDECFSLAQAVLLDDEEKALCIIPTAVRFEKITVQNLLEWPLFRNLREGEKFKETIDSINRTLVPKCAESTPGETPNTRPEDVAVQGAKEDAIEKSGTPTT